ncbi:MAG: peptide-methionine (S)-S-oxide reductase [Gammaproteobacteria bacterium]|nr:MAG: peptide-methionine (S)-S-oxide reductase [Gammaproteobacteria bacterium]TND02281.1 MAG: peptide-methionine (S)-S-oxide reductase [Gammaproteobacteria bacterium]
MRLRHATTRILAGMLLTGLSIAIQGSEEIQMTSGHNQKATFAGGCFWCVESDFDKVPGVIETVSGYTGGAETNPTYKQVSAGSTGHAEAVQITYDPDKISYERLLEIFWHSIDPTTANRQFCDVGRQYRTAIFYHDEHQKQLAEASKATLGSAKPFAETIVTEIVLATEFYAAEDYHQDYYKKNPLRYNFYRYSCGRDARLEELWGKSG